MFSYCGVIMVFGRCVLLGMVNREFSKVLHRAINVAGVWKFGVELSISPIVMAHAASAGLGLIWYAYR